jgi:hypothetical protein
MEVVQMAMTARLSKPVEDRFRQVTADAGMSMNSALEEAVIAWMDQIERQHLRETAEDIATRHAKLLARLAE